MHEKSEAPKMAQDLVNLTDHATGDVDHQPMPQPIIEMDVHATFSY